MKIQTPNLQEQLIQEFGRKICHMVKYWKPVNEQLATCLVCGERHYHIIEHVMKCHPEGENEKESGE